MYVHSRKLSCLSAMHLALNPGFPFWILSHSFWRNSDFLQRCKTKSRMESLGLRLLCTIATHFWKGASILSEFSVALLWSLPRRWSLPVITSVRWFSSKFTLCSFNSGISRRHKKMIMVRWQAINTDSLHVVLNICWPMHQCSGGIEQVNHLPSA